MKRLKNKLSQRFSTMPKKLSNNSIHRSLAFLIILGQCFGLMPISGISAPSERYIRFSWKSWKVLYTALVLVGTGFVLILSAYNVIKRNSTIYQITAVVFFGSSFIVHILFITLARKWAKLMRACCIVEISMRSYGAPLKISRRLKIMAACILIPATVEHVLVVVKNFIVADNCKQDGYDTFQYFIVVLSYPQVFEEVRYTMWAGILAQAVNVISTFSWTYIDLFIILMSTSLALRFKQVTQRVALYVDTKVADKQMWQNVREDYNRLCKLCYKFNDALSNIILVSFGSNLYFILVQFFNSLRHMDSALDKVYFFFSFTFLIIRTICVCLYGAWINDESQKPLPLLNSVASENYNIEIAGAIVTYELVLIQFYGYLLQEDKNSHNSTCR